jgi:hypothetical protein
VSETPCPRCAQATTDGLLCHPCTQTYTRARKDLTRFTPELRTAWLRQDNVARGIIHRDDRSLELAEAEAAEERAIPARLRSATGRIALISTRYPSTSKPAPCTGARSTGSVAPHRPATAPRTMIDAAELVDADPPPRRPVEEAIDRREPELYLGACDAPDIHLNDDGEEELVTLNVCGVHLYARAGDVTSPALGAATSTRSGPAETRCWSRCGTCWSGRRTSPTP